MKRILLITEPRTGSTSLMYSIGSAYNFSTQFEPDKKGKLKIKDNTVVKIIATEWRGIKYYEDLIEQFDKTILLSRRNLKEQSEAFWALYMLNESQPDRKWSEKDLPKNLHENEFFISRFEKLKKRKAFLKILSEKTNLQINYYEDVFKDKTLLEKDVKLDLKYLGPQYKLRTKGESTIL